MIIVLLLDERGLRRTRTRFTYRILFLRWVLPSCLKPLVCVAVCYLQNTFTLLLVDEGEGKEPLQF